ncbi:hypothetical protein GCM10017779_11300 [Streptomyces capillispiralis]|nr:hypothetical protein GCM10017779_11300 [Streptomyces capillispiralis]
MRTGRPLPVRTGGPKGYGGPGPSAADGRNHRRLTTADGRNLQRLTTADGRNHQRLTAADGRAPEA